MFEVLMAHKDLVPWVSAALTLIAIIVALVQPRRAQRRNKLNELIAYRNIARIAQRFVVDTLEDALRDKWHPKESFDYEVCLESLEAIKLEEIVPPALIPYFVEVQHMTKRGNKVIAEKIKEENSAANDNAVKGCDHGY